MPNVTIVYTRPIILLDSDPEVWGSSLPDSKVSFSTHVYYFFTHFNNDISYIVVPICSCTPLHMSAGHRSKLEVSFLLVENGARIYENNIHGVRPVDLEPV